MNAAPLLLLIDDDPDQTARLTENLSGILDRTGAVLEVIHPGKDDSTRDLLDRILVMRPTLVVTDHDLTAQGPAGLMGDTIIAWCRTNAIPVGDYSRKLEADLEEPDIFEFRFSKEADQAAPQIAELLLGFHALAKLVAAKPDAGESWSNRLADLLGHPDAAASFSLYSARTGATHGTVIDRLEKRYGDAAKDMLANYVLGHLLKNGILRYPGPLMGAVELCSYLAISDSHADSIGKHFTAARYSGPFGSIEEFFWHEEVDSILVDLAEAQGKLDGDIDDDRHRRAILASILEPGLHACNRCGGERGGYRCPYTERTVCNRADCSVPTSSWIPPGAYLTRVEKDYYDQWSPLLGL